jgi:hypothetical protein
MFFGFIFGLLCDIIPFFCHIGVASWAQGGIWIGLALEEGFYCNQ